MFSDEVRHLIKLCEKTLRFFPDLDCHWWKPWWK